MKLLKKIYWFIDEHSNYFLTRWVVPLFMYLLPVKENKVVFFSYGGKGYGGNCRYIAEEILRQKLPWDIVWLVNDLSTEMPEGIRKVMFSSLNQTYELSTAKVIVTNVKCGMQYIKKKNQYDIQTWHSCYPPKLIEKEAEDKLSPDYVKASKRDSYQTDLFLSNSAAMTRLIKNAFWCESEIMECGFPRNDVFFTADAAQLEQIRNKLGIGADTKLVLYAPTFRDNGAMDAYSLDCLAVLEKLRGRGEDWRLLTRLHPNVDDVKGLFPESEYIINATTYPDMQELLLVSDILITDYSSTPPEFALMGKQVYIYAPDVPQYQALRGLREDYFTSPYPVNTTNEALLKQMDSYSPESAAEQARAYREFSGGMDKGDASKQVVQRLEAVISGRWK